MIDINLDSKTILTAGVVIIGLYWLAKREAVNTAKAAADYVNSGQIGENLYDATHDENNNPTALGGFFDWLAGIEKGVDY